MKKKSSPTSWTALNARCFDPRGKLTEDFADLAGTIVRMTPETPLAVPLDAAQRATAENPHAPWGLNEDLRLQFALKLLHMFERCDIPGLETFVDCMRYLRGHPMPKINPMGPVIVNEINRSIREKRSVAKKELREEAERANAPGVPPPNKASAFYQKHGLQDFGQKRGPREKADPATPKNLPSGGI